MEMIVKPMKLTIAVRNALRRELRNHPEIKQHVSSIAEVSRLRKKELLALAKKLSIDVKALMMEEDRKFPQLLKEHKTEEALETMFEEEELERFRHSEKCPAFEGTLEFDVKIELLGKSVTRKARVIWQYTPEWEYYDLNRHCLMRGFPGDQMHAEILKVSTRQHWDTGEDGVSRKRKSLPTWEPISLLNEGVLMTEEMLEELDERIDQICRKEDAKRRSTANNTEGDKFGKPNRG
jgi:hypothetical protein